MSDKIKDLAQKVANEIEETVGNKYGFHNITLDIVEDDFVISEEEKWSDYFYIRVSRSSFEVTSLKMKRKQSFSEITECCNTVVSILKKYSKHFDKIFGVKLETIQDFVDNVVTLLDSGIDKRYCIGKTEKTQNSWNNSERVDEYGLLFNPACFFSIEFDDDAKQYEGKSNMKFYCEWDRDTISPEILSKFLCDIVDVNKDYIQRCIDEMKENKDE